ncbi:VOC family protein [Microbacterium sp. M1A1_1b]
MRITQVTLPVRSLDTVAAWWRPLGFPTIQGPDRVSVDVGHTRVHHEPDPALIGTHHLAMTIPTGTFDAAVAWIADRAPVLSRDGITVFEGPDGWDSRSVYFDGPDGQVLEFIERRVLPAEHVGPFTADSVVGVSEVGVVVEDVVATAQRLADVGVAPYAAPPTAGFGAVGDVHGLLVLVAPGRPWLPTTDRIAADSSVTIDVGLPRPVVLGAGKVLR